MVTGRARLPVITMADVLIMGHSVVFFRCGRDGHGEWFAHSKVINRVSFLILWHNITLATYYLHTKFQRSIFMEKKVVALQSVVADGTASGRRFWGTAAFCPNSLKFFDITSWYWYMLFLRSLGKIPYQWNLFNLRTFFVIEKIERCGRDIFQRCGRDKMSTTA